MKVYDYGNDYAQRMRFHNEIEHAGDRSEQEAGEDRREASEAQEEEVGRATEVIQPFHAKQNKKSKKGKKRSS